MFPPRVRTHTVSGTGMRPVFAENFFLGDGRMGKTGRCVFAPDEQPKNVSFRFAVRPAECFGKTGGAIYSAIKHLA